MQHFDVTLKWLLQRSGGNLLQQLVSAPVTSWIPMELPKFQNPQVDLLGELADGTLFHMELQSSHDADMPLRMAEYCLGIYRQQRRFARQVVLYVGSDPMRMSNRLAAQHFSFEYQLVDARTLDGEQPLASPKTSDNVMAILTNLQNSRAAVRAVLARIGESDDAERASYLQALLTLAGLRGLEEIVEEETKKMPILNEDILNNKVLGREFKRGLQEGRQEGHQEGRQEGRQEGELNLLRRQMERRFGVLPGWAEQTLAKRSASELEELGVRLLDAASLEDLLG